MSLRTPGLSPAQGTPRPDWGEGQRLLQLRQTTGPGTPTPHAHATPLVGRASHVQELMARSSLPATLPGGPQAGARSPEGSGFRFPLL